MPSAFVAMLAAKGARDPEALAAWIGRRKHGRAAFAKLAAAARKKSGSKKSGSGRSSSGSATAPRPSAADIRAKTLTRDERIRVNRRARELTTAEALRAADERTPTEAEATTREQVLERRAINKAAARGVAPAGSDEVTRQQAADAIRRRDDRAALERMTTRDKREQARADMERIRADYQRAEAERKAALTAPLTADEEARVDKAARGLAERPEMFAQVDARVPAEADATTRQQVIQRRAIERARALRAAAQTDQATAPRPSATVADAAKAVQSAERAAARARVERAQQRADAAREAADRANEAASAAYGRFAGGQPILSGHHSERSALRDRARADAKTRRAIAATEAANRAEADLRKAQADAQGAEMRAARSRPWQKSDFQPGDIVQIDRAGRPGESYRVIRANAKSVTVSRGYAGMDDKKIPYDKILSRTRDGQTTSDPGADAPSPTTTPPAKTTTARPKSLAQVSEAKIEAGRQQARLMSDRMLQDIRKSLVGKRDPLSRAQRQVINDEIKRRREQAEANRKRAQARREREKARTLERIRRERAEREAAEERRRQEEAARLERQRREQEAREAARAERQAKRQATVAEVAANVQKAKERAERQAAGKSPAELREAAKAASEKVQAFNRRDTVRDGKPGIIAPGSPEYDMREGARLNEEAAAAYQVAAQAETDPGMRRSLEWAAEQHEATAALHRQYAAGLIDERPETPGEMARYQALTEMARGASLGLREVRAQEHRQAEAERARVEAEQRAARNRALLERLNNAPGKPTRKAMTKEERDLVNYEANRAALNDAHYERLRPYEDESAQTNRVDVLKSRAFAKAKAERIKNGWKLPEQRAADKEAATAPKAYQPTARR